MTDEQRPAPLPVAWLAVVCTDRGQHDRARLCDVRWHPDYPGDQWRVAETGDPDSGSWVWMEPEGDSSAWMYQFECRRCGRRPRLSAEKWRLLMAGLHPKTWPNGVSQRDLDLSLLPF